jgi:hypothetical protein
MCGDAIYTADIWNDPAQVQPGTLLFQMQVQMGEEGFEVWRRSVDKLTRLDVDEVHFAHDANYTRCGQH